MEVRIVVVIAAIITSAVGEIAACVESQWTLPVINVTSNLKKINQTRKECHVTTWEPGLFVNFIRTIQTPESGWREILPYKSTLTTRPRQTPKVSKRPSYSVQRATRTKRQCPFMVLTVRSDSWNGWKSWLWIKTEMTVKS